MTFNATFKKLLVKNKIAFFISRKKMVTPLDNESDKFFWHGYIQFYERFFIDINPGKILEMGVANGNSIRYLLRRFPTARIWGTDIIQRREAWPQDPRFLYEILDQSEKSRIKKFFAENNFDLIIEDGSHDPVHQTSCLISGIHSLNSGGIYILEDIHTSHPRSAFYVSGAPIRRLVQRFRRRPRGNSLSVLLAIDHYKRLGIEVGSLISEKISKQSLFEPDDVLNLSKKIKRISLYRRAHFPDQCICGRREYDYSNYMCFCGNPIFSDKDSMSFVIECH